MTCLRSTPEGICEGRMAELANFPSWTVGENHPIYDDVFI